jgi:hypothetical protein
MIPKDHKRMIDCLSLDIMALSALHIPAKIWAVCTISDEGDLEQARFRIMMDTVPSLKKRAVICLLYC